MAFSFGVPLQECPHLAIPMKKFLEAPLSADVLILIQYQSIARVSNSNRFFPRRLKCYAIYTTII